MLKKKIQTVTTYQFLLKTIKQELVTSLKDIEAYVDRHNVVTHWRVGQNIRGYLDQRPQGSITALYNQLSDDLNINPRTLQECVQFFDIYHHVDPDLPLTWSHYRVLARLPSDQDRLKWQKKIIAQKITAKQLPLLIKQAFQVDVPNDSLKSLPKPHRGKLYTYRIVKATYSDADQPFMVDCGFNFRIIPPPCDAILNNSRMVSSIKDEKGYRLVRVNAIKADVFTFKAIVERVVDGDTLIVNVDCGFGLWIWIVVYTKVTFKRN